jgi:APA family basic amino acid/polyamine antiporter
VSSAVDPPSRLSRSLGLRGAVTVGVSAMIGTGVFAVWQPALQRAGSWLIAAVIIAAIVAALNATSTARLAARFPQAGGVYAYGRIKLGRFFGVSAGVVFLIGKTASASAAALTIGLYVWPEQSKLVAFAAIGAVLLLNLRGIVRSTFVAGVMVIGVVAVLAVFALVAVTRAPQVSGADVVFDGPDSAIALLAASALIFVAFAGYARITVLGEEVRNPSRVIPTAVALSFVVVTIVYTVIAFVVWIAASEGIAIAPAALAGIAEAVGGDALAGAVTIAAVLAAGAVLLSLIAGVGRTFYAMAAGGDAPRAFAAVSPTRSVPYRAEIAAALGAGVLVGFGGLTLALGVSAAMILTYYAIAHISALRIDRRPGAAGLLLATTAVVGLVGCTALVVAVIIAG